MKKLLFVGTTLFIILLTVSCGGSPQSSQKSNTKITKIDIDTESGGKLWREIVRMDYNQMTSKYGQPDDLYSGSMNYKVSFPQIKVRKQGTDFWCELEIKYTNQDNKFHDFVLSKCSL